MTDSRVHALILAAGGATRFQGKKLTASFRGKGVLDWVLEVISGQVQTGTLGGAVLVHATRSLAARAHALGFNTVQNPEPANGLAGSLRLGLAGLEVPGVAAALIVPGDQPLVRGDVIATLVQRWNRQRSPAVRPRYRETPEIPGHPVLVDRVLWRYAAEFQGDSGFNSLFSARPELMTTIEVPGRNPDIDTRADLERLETQG